MSNLSINQALSGLQNLLPLQQQVADAAESDSSGDPTAAEAAGGQDLPDATAETATAAGPEGAAAPVLSPDMTAVLLQFQESQEMSAARALLYGDGSSDDPASLFGDPGADDPLQAFLSQMSDTDTSLMSSNQTLLDYLEAADAPEGQTDAFGLGTDTPLT
jgi:hypothetical protein